MRQNVKNIVRDYAKLTFATAIMAVAVRFFEYTNNFSLGGVTGLSILLAKFLPWATSSIGFVLNICQRAAFRQSRAARESCADGGANDR